MERLITLSKTRSAAAETGFERFLMHEIDWNERFVLITGQRGTGKTTLLLQHLNRAEKKAIYLALDDLYFEVNRLIVTLDSLYKRGYRVFYLDEVHRYRHWSKDLKNACDNYPDIQIVATGSSILELSKGQADLSRRAAVYKLPGLSFREFLHLHHGLKQKSLKLEDILTSHQKIAAEISDRIQTSKTFRDYLRFGHYPYFRAGIPAYPQKLRETVYLVLDSDIALYEDLNTMTVRNMKKLMYVISRSVPFKPNISRLSTKLDIPRNSILRILDLLDRVGVLALLRSDTQGVSYLQKPEKIYLDNPNLIYLFSDNRPASGNLRETFFLNQLQVRHNITASRFADFMVDETWTFEVGGPSKTGEQIRGLPGAYIAADDIKEGSGNRIPLWLFGFLY